MKIRTCSISAHKGYMCKHAHHSIHKVCLGKFLFPFIQWMGLLCTNSWCCKSVAVTTMRTFSGNLSMPAAETLHNPSGSCHACMTVYVLCLWAALFECVCMPALGLALFTMHAEKFMAHCKSMDCRLVDYVQIFMNCKLKFSKVLNLNVVKHLSKQAHGVWVLLTYMKCGSCLSIFFHKVPSGERKVWSLHQQALSVSSIKS